jgi:prepilin-type N-terminal cleavage/methylation domain-containing protein
MRIKPAQGFTLIELMITVAIGIVMVGGGLAAYRGAGEREEVKLAGLGFQTNLKSFQQKAFAGEKPVGCLGTLEDFRIEVGAGLGSYIVKAECSLVDGPETEFELIQGVEFDAIFSDLIFYTLKSEIGGAQTIVINSAEGNYTYEITVEASGVIQGELL